MPLPRIAISVLHWRTALATRLCLESLAALRYPNFRVLLIDNASDDGSVEYLKSRFPELDVCSSPANLGYAAGHAQALDWARAQGCTAVWLLNSDVEVEPDALGHLVHSWQVLGDALYGVATLSGHRGEVVLDWPAQLLRMTHGLPWLWRDRRLSYAPWLARGPTRVGAVSGAALFIPLHVVATHGWMEPDWFLYNEEVDYCWRLGRAGVATWLVPQSRVWHTGAGSQKHSARLLDAMHYYQSRNQVRLLRRHAGTLAALWLTGKKLLRALWTLPQRPPRALGMLKAVAHAWTGRVGALPAPVHRPATLPSLRLIRVRAGWARAREALHRRFAGTCGLVQQTIGLGMLVHDRELPPFTREYQLLLLRGLGARLLRRQGPQVLVCARDPVEHYNRPTLRIGVQWEHTLVVPGGRDSAGAPEITLYEPDGPKPYLVRIDRLAELNRLDWVVDYSNANIVHVRDSGCYPALAQRHVLLAPLLAPMDFAMDGRVLPLLTLFADPEQSRRREFNARVKAAGLNVSNWRGIYRQCDLNHLYRRSQILVNVHQTAHHHTFEELRILPALLNGVLIVSESVPLRHTIPYHEYIIWSSYEDLPATIRRVQANYHELHQQRFNDPRLRTILLDLAAGNEHALRRIVPQA